MRVVWPDEPLAQVNRIVLYVRVFDPAAARRLGNRLFDAGNSLADFPERGRLAENGTRELVTVRPYVIRYRFGDDIVRIVGIRHAAQLPDAD